MRRLIFGASDVGTVIIGHVCKTISCYGVLIGLLLSLPIVGQAGPIPFTLTRVVDTNTPIPGGTGNFVFFTDPFTTSNLDGRPAASIEDGIVVFSGSGASGQSGIYAAQPGGSLIRIVDTNTPLPDGTGNFQLFGTPSLSQGSVAFPGSGVIGPVDQGAFLTSIGGSLTTVADHNTEVPGGIGEFQGIRRVLLDAGTVAFVHSSVGRDRIFASDNNGQITLLADGNDFGVFNGLSFHNGIVAFISRQKSIFAASVGNQPMLVVESLPGRGSIITGFNPSIDNDTIAFLVQEFLVPGAGVYISTLDGSLTPAALVGMVIPGGTGTFAGFDADSPSQRDGIIAFRGFGPSGQEGIYASIRGSLIKIIDLADSLDGKALSHLFLGFEAVSGNQIVFSAQFTDGSRGIYVAQLIDNLNNLVAFAPLGSTFKTTADATGCPDGFAGQFSFSARLTDNNDSPPVSDLVVQVNTLSNGNLLLNADGTPRGAGATLTVPQVDGFSDGVLSAGEFVDVPFRVCLRDSTPFTFFVDVLGTETRERIGPRVSLDSR